MTETTGTIDAETAAQLQAGKLEQMCPDCGRWSAATHYCSWCFRSMGPADWYRNGDKAQRAARMPKAAPANPPSEYRHSLSQWPPKWGPYPGEVRPQRVARDAQTPLKAAPEPDAATSPVWPEIAA
jgi:hypothetical protein